MKTKLTILIILAALALPTFAQETKQKNCNLAVGADFASMYLWRGFQLGSGPAVQPWAEFSYKGFAIGTWGSYEFTGAFKEVDIYAKYTYSDFSLMFYDLFFPDYPGLDPNYYNFNNETTGHVSELGLSYNGSEKIPFSVFGGVILYGVPIDHQIADTTASNYSTYFEVNYLGQFNEFSYNVFAGFTPTESYLYEAEKFSFINLGLSAKKEIKVTESFSMPLKLTLATNPTSKKIFVTLLVSF